MGNKIWIIIPVHNRKDMLKACLQKLCEQTFANYKIIVVDDGSEDETEQMVINEFPDITLLRGDGQLWWTGAINMGLMHTMNLCDQEDNILVLNDDLVVPTDYLSNLDSIAQQNKNSLIGSVIVDIKNRDLIHNGGMRINWLTAKWQTINSGAKLSSFRKGHCEDVSTLTGRGVLIPSKAFRELCIYNRKHYRQCGDTEFPRRAYKAGYRLIVSYDAPVFSHIDDKGHINHQVRYRLSDARNYFFGMRSNQNIRYRFWFSFDSATNVLVGSVYFVCDLCRNIWHFTKRLKFN